MDGPAPVISGIITGAGAGAVVLVSRIPRPSIMACNVTGKRTEQIRTRDDAADLSSDVA